MVALFCVVAFGLALGASVPCCNSASPEQIHLALTNNVNEMIITWTTANAEPTLAQVGNVTFRGTSHTYTIGDWVGVIHVAVATDLKPATRYAYRVGNGTLWSTERSFTTAPAVLERPMMIGVVGDMGAVNSNKSVAHLTSLVKAHVARDGDGIDVVIHDGDISYANGVQHIWDDFMREIDPVASYVPYMVTVGNHESPFNFTSYKSRFAMPRSAADPGPSGWNAEANMFYSFIYARVYFIAISTEHELASNSTQYAFLERELTHATALRSANAITWIIVMSHRPLYCSNTRNDFSDCYVNAPLYRHDIEALINQYHIDMYITAHEHAYERTHPVFEEKVFPSLTDAKAPVYIMNGAAGGPENLDHFWHEPRPAWSAYRESTYGYCVMTIDEVTNPQYARLEWKFFADDDNHEHDSFTLLKTRTRT